MMHTKLKEIFLPLILFLGFSYQQTIFLLPYNGSSITPCSSGLIQSVDEAIFYGQINIIGKQDSLENVNFEIKKQHSTYNILCYIHLSDCTGYKLSYCYCLKTDESHVFNVVINITAYANYSQASLRGKMTFTDTVQYSEEQMLPKIYDTSLVHSVLYVNDKVVDVRRCKISLTSPEIMLVFFVPEYLHVPTRLLLKDSNTSTVLKNGTGFLSYSRTVYGELFLTLFYEVCSIQDKQHNFVCLFKSDTSWDLLAENVRWAEFYDKKLKSNIDSGKDVPNSTDGDSDVITRPELDDEKSRKSCENGFTENDSLAYRSIISSKNDFKNIHFVLKGEKISKMICAISFPLECGVIKNGCYCEKRYSKEIIVVVCNISAKPLLFNSGIIMAVLKTNENVTHSKIQLLPVLKDESSNILEFKINSELIIVNNSNLDMTVSKSDVQVEITCLLKPCVIEIQNSNHTDANGTDFLSYPVKVTGVQTFQVKQKACNKFVLNMTVTLRNTGEKTVLKSVQGVALVLFVFFIIIFCLLGVNKRRQTKNLQMDSANRVDITKLHDGANRLYAINLHDGANRYANYMHDGPNRADATNSYDGANRVDPTTSFNDADKADATISNDGVNKVDVTNLNDGANRVVTYGPGYYQESAQFDSEEYSQCIHLDDLQEISIHQ